jgi:hypothetical protein
MIALEVQGSEKGTILANLSDKFGCSKALKTLGMQGLLAKSAASSNPAVSTKH